MTTSDSSHLRSIARRFWQEATEQSAFPRDPAKAALYALPISILYPARLSIHNAHRWFTARGITLPLAGPDRLLHGCLAAYQGMAFLLVDGQDSLEQQRFTIAHEVAHFLIDYYVPRERLRARLGPQVTEILDGKRTPTVDDRIDALLADVSLRAHTHLMGRAEDGAPCGTVLRAECLADSLAIELLAPAYAVWSRVKASTPISDMTYVLEDLLRTCFGLPRAIAAEYARALVRRRKKDTSVREWLGL